MTQAHSKFSNASANRYIEFNLGRERFAISLLTVKEVIALPEMTDVPFTPDYYLGVMNLRGTVVSVIDLRKRMQIDTTNTSSENAVIIVSLESNLVGMVVDSINRVLTVAESDIAPPPEMEASRKLDFLLGCFKKEKDLILFIDLAKLMDKKDHEAIHKGQLLNMAV
ncbi:MAG: chemotaxis protein CheW [Bdellovibrionota bacterium]